MFFGAIRSKSGLNNNPNAEQFRASYKRMLNQIEISISSYANCTDFNTTPLLQCYDALSNTDSNQPLQEMASPEMEKEWKLFRNDDITTFAIKTDMQHLGNKIAPKITCEQCIEVISNVDTLLLICKAAEFEFRTLVGIDKNVNVGLHFNNIVMSAVSRSAANLDFLLPCDDDHQLQVLQLDFYVDNHWDRLPPCWRSCFDELDAVGKLKNLLIDENPKSSEVHIWPLSILALRTLFRKYCLARNLPGEGLNLGEQLQEERCRFYAHRNLFNKSVKLKKRHEIEKFAEQCWKTGRRTQVEHLVDIGSGQGNLARTLCYGFGFKVCCIEQDEKLVEAARLKDEELSSRLKRRQTGTEALHHPIHLSKKVNLEEIDPGNFVQMIRDAFNVEKDRPFHFGLVGLHPCGDLAVFLMKLFLSCPEAKFIKLVCCCYMKLTTVTDRSTNYGFPVSAFSKQLGLNLSYEAREIACHAIEQYHGKLESDYQELKVHAFRAAAEKIIVNLRPEWKHSGLRSTKVGSLSFPEYCDRATSGTGIELSSAAVESPETANDLNHWERVVKFYTLRLMFAPLVESIVLYDRWLYLLEQGIDSEIDVIFDPVCSPRNHALTGEK